MTNIKDILSKIQNNQATITEQRVMLNEIKSRFKKHQHTNYLYDQDEIEAVFLEFSWKALFRAKLDIGDPVSFACQRGHFATIDYYRKVSSQMLVLVCSTCNNSMTYDRRNKRCKMCGGSELHGQEKYSQSTNNDKFAIKDSFVEGLELQDYIAECLKLVDKNGIDPKVKECVLESIENRESINIVSKRKKLNKIQLESLVKVREIFISHLKLSSSH